MKKRFALSLVLFSAISFSGYRSDAYAHEVAATIRVLNATHLLSATSHAAIVKLIQNNFDVSAYREIRTQVIFNAAGEADHLLVYLHSQKFHRMDLASLKLDSNFEVVSKEMNYRMRADDIEQLPGTKAAEAHCPDPSVQFIAFAPNEVDVEQQVTEAVAKAAEAAHLKTVRLLKADATRQNYLNYLVCPNLQGNFYDGDANPYAFVTVDGQIQNDDVSGVLAKAFRFKVTNIWLACEAYNDPMLSAVEKDAQAQKYAAGINDLEIGPSDQAGACAMEAAIAGSPMTAAFQACYQRLDVKTDQWGFGGSGADYFGM